MILSQIDEKIEEQEGLKRDACLWVYNYDFEFELAGVLNTHRGQGPFHPWYFLNRSWHVLLPLATANDLMLVYEKPSPQVSEVLGELLGYLPGFVTLEPKRESNSVFDDLEGSVAHLKRLGVGDVCPWGWSPKAVLFARLIGTVGEGRGKAEIFRWVNSKETSHNLREKYLPPSCRIPGQTIHPVDLKQGEVESIITRFQQQHGPLFVKHLFGSAGKLADYCEGSGYTARKTRKWQSWVRSAGGIVLEQVVSIKQEWSVQVEIEFDGSVRPIALTRLFSSPGGNYLGTMIVDEDQQQLNSHMERLSPVLEDIIRAGYYGPLGVDLIETTGGEFKLLEINGRLTMGRVAFEWHRGVPGMGASLFSNLFMKGNRFQDRQFLLNRISVMSHSGACRSTLLNLVPDPSGKGVLVSLLIQADEPDRLWGLLDDCKQAVKKELDR